MEYDWGAQISYFLLAITLGYSLARGAPSHLEIHESIVPTEASLCSTQMVMGHGYGLGVYP